MKLNQLFYPVSLLLFCKFFVSNLFHRFNLKNQEIIHFKKRLAEINFFVFSLTMSNFSVEFSKYADQDIA